MTDSIINDSIIESNSNINVKEVPIDGIDLLSNKRKIKPTQHYDEDENEEEVSDVDEISDNEVEDLSDVDGDDEPNNEEYDEEEISDIEEEEIDDEEDESSFEEIQKEKQELLFKLKRLEKSGLRSSRQYTMDSKISDIRDEFRTLKKQKELEKSIKFSREMLMACVGGIEYLNGKFDPLDVKLEGWSESVMENIDNYDEVFEELYDKYNEKVDIAPEIRLIMMVGGSAFMYHLTNSLFKSAIPNVNDILKQNPDLMNNIQQATMNTMNNNAQNNQGPQMGPGMFANMMNFGNQRSAAEQPPESSSKRSQMRGPTGVDDILEQIHQEKPNSKRGINLGI